MKTVVVLVPTQLESREVTAGLWTVKNAYGNQQDFFRKRIGYLGKLQTKKAARAHSRATGGRPVERFSPQD